MNLETRDYISVEIFDPHALCVLTPTGAEFVQQDNWNSRKQLIALAGKLDLTPEFSKALEESRSGLGSIDTWSLCERHGCYGLECTWDWGITRPRRWYRLTHLPHEWRHLVSYDGADEERMKRLGW